MMTIQTHLPRSGFSHAVDAPQSLQSLDFTSYSWRKCGYHRTFAAIGAMLWVDVDVGVRGCGCIFLQYTRCETGWIKIVCVGWNKESATCGIVVFRAWQKPRTVKKADGVFVVCLCSDCGESYGHLSSWVSADWSSFRILRPKGCTYPFVYQTVCFSSDL